MRIHGTDDAGRRHGPVNLRIDAGATAHFDSDDLEQGNESKGFTGALGDGSGDWRLELSTDLDIEHSAYVRTADGFLATMHSVARTVEVAGETVHRVPIFNPASNRVHVSWLRLANLTGESVDVTIRARDDAGEPAPLGEVRLSIPAHGAQRLSARQLESGSTGLRGRLGDGAGKWQLSVTADGAIEVMSLLQSPTGHLSNLSTALRSAVEATGFEVVIEGATTVRPLQAVSLTVPGGLSVSDYTVLIDLSGTGAFAEADTLEVEGLTTHDDRILFASPLTQMLSESNTAHRLVVRMKRESDQVLSRTLRLSVDDIVISADRAGFSTTVLDTVLKSIYSSADDPLLQLDGAAVRPGLMVDSARRLGLDTTFSDVQAEAILQSLLGMPVTELASGLVTPAPPAADHGPVHARQASVADTDPAGGERPPACDALTETVAGGGEACKTVTKSWSCMDAYNKIYYAEGGTRGGVDDFDEMTECIRNTMKNTDWRKLVREKLANRISGALIGKIYSAGKEVITGYLKRRWGDKAVPLFHDGVAALKHGTNAMKVSEAVSGNEGADTSDDDRHVDASERVTKRGKLSNFETRRDMGRFVTQVVGGMVGEAEMELAARDLEDHERDAFSTIVNESDRLRREGETIDDLEGVYTGEDEPLDAIMKHPDLGRSAGSSCEAGYEEFVIDDRTSTCVLQSLVERNCYAGSRRTSDVDLGDSQACLYYSLDFLKPDGTCRENYEKVFFQGRWTCRWADLLPEQPSWYTLDRTLGNGGNSGNSSSSLAIAGHFDPITGPEGLSAVGYVFTQVPDVSSLLGDIPPAPDVSGLETGCHGSDDSSGDREGRWVCVYSSLISFDTYESGRRHGPSGSYNATGQPVGYFGSYDNGNRDGVWLFFYSSGEINFDTYESGRRHGPSGSYNANGQPVGDFGSYDNGNQDGVWLCDFSIPPVRLTSTRTSRDGGTVRQEVTMRPGNAMAPSAHIRMASGPGRGRTM